MMRAPLLQGRLGYFGKLPTRSDFVKVSDDIVLMGVLDDWLAQVMSALAVNPLWKVHYDALAPVDFAVVGARRKHAIAGHIRASRDQAGRRFPFLMVGTLALAAPTTFVTRAPRVLAPLWRCLGALGAAAMAAPEPDAALQCIPDCVIGLDEDCAAAHAAFLAESTVGSLAALLGEGDVRRTLLALGLLLQPVMQIGSNELDKSLVLPLPAASTRRGAVAAFWLELIAPFLAHGEFELSLFLTELAQQPVLVVGFRGVSALTLQGIIDPLIGQQQQIGFGDTGWIDERLRTDIDVRALASYLDQPLLPLGLARELFLRTFIGARP